jgi:iron complex transport system permease protein
LKNKTPWLLIAAILLLTALFITDLIIGQVIISLSDFMAWLSGSTKADNITAVVLSDFRLPRAITAVSAGIALSLSGLVMQTFFRNPLAGPYVMGISSGAALGVAIFLMMIPAAAAATLGSWGLAAAGCIGALLLMMLLIAAAERINDITILLIAGLLFSGAAAAFINVLQYFSNAPALKQYVIWTLGSLAALDMEQAIILFILVLMAALSSLLLIKPLNLLHLGEAYAATMGIRIRNVRRLMLVITSVVVGVTTAFCGPIAFVGLAVPHLCRLLLQTSDHKVLLPASILGGAIFLLMADILANLPLFAMSIPINTITSLFGAPFILWLIMRNRTKIPLM